jgi:hypothetical protein
LINVLFVPPEKGAAEALRQASMRVARTNPRWVELALVDLVRRNPGWLVSAEMDVMFTPYRGVVFATGSPTVIPDQSALFSVATPKCTSPPSSAPAGAGRIRSRGKRSGRDEARSSA